MRDADVRLIDRLQLAVGILLLVFPATDWLVRVKEESGIRVSSDFTMWEMLGIVNKRYAVFAVLGVLVIVAFAVVCLTRQCSESPDGVVTISGLLATLAIVLMMVNTDNGYTHGTGAWLSLVICGLATVASSGWWVWTKARSRR